MKNKHLKKMNKLVKKIVKDKKKTVLKQESHFVKPVIVKSVEKPVQAHPIAVYESNSVPVSQETINATPKKKRQKAMKAYVLFIYFMLIMLLVSGAYYFIAGKAFNSFALFSGSLVAFVVYLYMRKTLERYNRIKSMEHVFPDFISLMASNLRAGMTIDRALLASARKEFAPLDAEIMQVGKDILTGGEITSALQEMGKRIRSDEIRKTLQLIVSGIRSGGNMSVLLEETANNMRERMFVKKRASSNVLMYVIFIFFAVAIGAPILFALSTVLVEIMANMFSGIDVENVSVNLPFTISNINISTTFVFYFALVFIIASSILASLILGLVSKGEEREGFKYIFPLIITSVAVFLITRLIMMRYFVNFLG